VSYPFCTAMRCDAMDSSVDGRALDGKHVSEVGDAVFAGNRSVTRFVTTRSPNDWKTSAQGAVAHCSASTASSSRHHPAPDRCLPLEGL
jgi:hypothetical protein